MERSEKHQHLPLSKSSRQRGNEWIFRDVPSDITIEIPGRTFALHKFPLVSRSGRIRKIVADYRDSDISKIELLNLPGGAEIFELAAKFCYGINFEITPANVAQLCCVSDYLEMTEDYSKDSLGSRAEEYLDSVVCKNLEMCLEVLKQCENLLPLADELKVVGRCVDAIASKACTEQIASSFSRLEYSSSGRLHMSRPVKCESDWWIEDLSVLRVDFYQRVITAMKCRGVRPESIGASLMNYAEKELTKKSSLWNGSGQSRPDAVSGSGGQGLVVETIIGLLPVEKQVVPISFLFGLLRSAVLLDCSVASRLDLERRIGSQLDLATLDDLLIPSFHHAGDTLFDVDTVHRILVNFSQQDDSDDDLEDASVFETDNPQSPSQGALCKVSKLVDSYLAEIAPDANLKLNKFLFVAESLPAHARTIHDGLYRAIDLYLKVNVKPMLVSIVSYMTNQQLTFCEMSIKLLILGMIMQSLYHNNSTCVPQFSKALAYSGVRTKEIVCMQCYPYVDNCVPQIKKKWLDILDFQMMVDALIYDWLKCSNNFKQAHQGLSDADKRKLCKLIDFQKLSQEAGAHAATNERLPLQSIVQVLYFEQLRLRNALSCSFPDEDPKPMFHSWRVNSGALSASMSPKDNYASLRRENRELKLELARMRMRLSDLEKDHVCMKRTMEKSGSRKFMSSFSKKLGKLSFFGHGSSRASSSPSPSRQSHRTDSKVTDRTY